MITTLTYFAIYWLGFFVGAILMALVASQTQDTERKMHRAITDNRHWWHKDEEEQTGFIANGNKYTWDDDCKQWLINGKTDLRRLI